MAAYDESLAKQILLKLEDLFPLKSTGKTLKANEPAFESISDIEFFLALDALYKLGHVSGGPIRSGFTDELRDLYNLEITPLGRGSLLVSEGVLKEWTSYCWAFFAKFGTEFYQRWKGKVVSGFVGALAGFVAQHGAGIWTVLKDSTLGALVGVAIFAIYDAVRVPWLIHKSILRKEPISQSWWTGGLGMLVLIGMVGSAFYWASPLYTPKKNIAFAILENDEYVSVVNTTHAFKFLEVEGSKCAIRVTAPTENMQVARIIRSLAVDFCEVDLIHDPNAPEEEILKGTVDNAIVVHMAKEPSKRDGFVSTLGNVFSVRRAYELPPGSRPDLVWLQIGRGNPWRKDPTKPGTEF